MIKVTRVRLMGIPIDVLPKEHIRDAIKTMLASNRVVQVVIVHWWDMLRAQWNTKYRTILKNAELVIPASHALGFGIRILGKGTPHCYIPFDFVIYLLSALEQLNASVYLIGTNIRTVQNIERNVAETFPDLRIVGRYSANFSKQMEPNVIMAIKKASPDFLLTGSGLERREHWLYRNQHLFNPSILLWSKDIMDTLAERHPRPSKRLFRMGLGFLPGLFRYPWRIMRFPFFVLYLLYLLVALIFRL